MIVWLATTLWNPKTYAIDDLGRILTQENGKTLTEAKAELRRAIENVEVACGIPVMASNSSSLPEVALRPSRQFHR